MSGRHTHCLVSLRQHRLSKLCGLLFVALILVPFTAPFPTVHLDAASAGHSFDALPKDVKDQGGPDDDLVVLSTVSIVLPGAKVCMFESTADSSEPQQPPPHHTILRV